MSIFLWAAALVSGLTFVVHTFIGGKYVARPLLADTSLPIESKWLNYYCWHNTTIIIALNSGAYVWLAATPGQTPVILLLSVITATFSLLSIWTARKAGVSPLRLPSTSLFAVTSALGWAALLT